VDVVVGTQRVKMLPMLVEQARVARDRSPANSPLAAIVDVDTPYDEPSFPLGLTRHADPVKAYVTIIEGCNDFCAFCVVPYTRGHERMRSKAEILADVRAAVDSGRHEVQLLGQIVNHYQAPDDPSVISRRCSKRYTTSPASSASALPALIRGTRAID
jgi:tRNA-2-methylthio-N6-dimethylallyladenosine synthase